MYHLITRPQTDLEPFRSELEALGLHTLHDPVFDLVFMTPERPLTLDGVQALLMTSANGVRAFARVSKRRDVSVFAVGDSTAQQARDAGFSDVRSAGGDLDHLISLVSEQVNAEQGALFHPAASVRAGDLGQALTGRGFVYRRAVLYTARPAQALRPETIQLLRAGKISSLSFFSPRSAQTFITLAQHAGLMDSLCGCVAFCLSPAVAIELDGATVEPDHGMNTRIAPKPERKALLFEIKTHFLTQVS